MDIEKILLIISVVYIVIVVGILSILYEAMNELKKLLKEFINQVNTKL